MDDYRRLNDPAARRELERRGNFFIVEGELALRALVANAHRWPIRSVLVTPERRAALADLLDGIAAPVRVEPLSTLREITGFDVHRGVLASAERGEPLRAGDVLAAAAGSCVLVVHGVSDHENVGGLFRNAAAFGCGAVLLDRETADPLYRRSVRVSLGHVLRVPFARPDGNGFDELRAAGYVVVALTPRGETTIDAFAAPNDRVALVVGAEGPGLPDATLAAADARARIPMADGVDSLNVATAAAIALHHLHLRRRPRR